MEKAMKKTSEQIRKDITARISTAIQSGTMPWRQPWVRSPNSGHPCNFVSKRRYNGINPLILMLTAEEKGFFSKHWGTYSAWIKNLGCHVKKGEKGTFIILFKHFPK